MLCERYIIILTQRFIWTNDSLDKREKKTFNIKSWCYREAFLK